MKAIKAMADADKEAYRLIGEKAAELAKDPDVMRESVSIAAMEGKEAGERFIYRLAMAMLLGYRIKETPCT